MKTISTFARANKALLTLALVGAVVGSASARLTAGIFGWGGGGETAQVTATDTTAKTGGILGWLGSLFLGGDGIDAGTSGGTAVETGAEEEDWLETVQDVGAPAAMDFEDLYGVEFFTNSIFNNNNQWPDGGDGTVYTSTEGGDGEWLPPSCSGGLDEDGDGAMDMEDPKCDQVGVDGVVIGEILNCADGADNDGDRNRDGDDPKCQTWDGGGEQNGHGSAPLPSCTDSMDNDGDRDTDMADSDCELGGTGELTSSSF